MLPNNIIHSADGSYFDAHSISIVCDDNEALKLKGLDLGIQ
ncbi:MAG: hypothetical protein ABI045_03905 [Flavobacteriales bacterium]